MATEKLHIDTATERQIKERASIMEVLAYYGHSLKAAGMNLYRTNCPFGGHHSTNDLQVYPNKGFCRCYAHNDQPLDAIGYIMRREQCSYPRALQILGQIVGIRADATTAPRRPNKPISQPKAEPRPQKPLFLVNPADVDKSLSKQHRHAINQLWPYISKLFGASKADELFDLYRVGTNRQGNALFWQTDQQGNYRGANVIKYNPENGRRDHAVEPYSLFKAGDHPQERMELCLFGQHLITADTKTLCIVESEKTAIICHGYYKEKRPNWTWLATCGKQNKARLKRLEGLQNYRVILYPDADEYDSQDQSYLLWTKFAEQLRAEGVRAEVWQGIINAGIEPKSKKDIADLIEKILLAPQTTKPQQAPTIAETPQISTTAPKVDNLPPKAQTTKLEPKESEIRQYPYFERLVEADEPLRPNRTDLPVECPF